MAIDYKDTLAMPKTAFEMRGNLGVREPLFQKKWYDMDLYKEVLKKNEGHPFFVLHDGPPYANGNIHIGHALNKILKDFVLRYKTMKGFYTPYVPGWDTHGLPIEVAITKSGVNRKEISTADFRKKCEEYAYNQVAKQKENFKRLGVLGNFDDPYITLQHYFEAEQIRVFEKMALDGLIFKGLKPVYWSPSSESALAEAEIEYQDITSKSIYFKFPIINGEGDYKDASFLVWTTTPWTLPGNLAVCAGPLIEYVLFDSNKGKMICAEELLKSLSAELELEDVKILDRKYGKDLLDLKYKHPLYDRVSPTINADYVTTTDGSGFVHIAPGYGEEDFIAGKEYGLDILVCVNDKGYQTKEAGKYEGLFYDASEDVIIEDLKACGSLLKLKPITHSYPHDWRTKKPVIFRATSQWFASIDKLKETLLKEIKNANWIPKWGELRISNMIKDRKDWCISRQRVWGVPIPIFYCEDGEPVVEKKVFDHIADLFEQYGSDIWFKKDAKELLPEGYTNSHSPNGKFTKETDIMDVWFDSGSSSQAVLKHYNLPYPADLYLEGSDQYRGWFNSSLIVGVATTGKAPYKAVLSHGFTLDGMGRKMSKSLGNTIDPQKVVNQYGADILRMWVASCEYTADQRISDDIIKQVSEVYRKIRNTFKFLLANISDLDKLVDFKDLNNVDKYMMIKLNDLVKDVTTAYENYEFNEVYRLVNAYIATLLSPFYLDFTKDILYIEKVDSPARRGVQTVLYHTAKTLISLLTPIIPHTATEAYDQLPLEKLADAYLENMPVASDYSAYDELKNNFDKFMDFRNDILKALEDARNDKVIGKSFNAKLTITPTKEIKELLDKLDSNIGQMCIVSQFELKDVANEVKIEVAPAEGFTCSRCWQIVPSIDNGELCPRCRKIVDLIRK